MVEGGLRLTYRNRDGELWVLDATRETTTLTGDDIDWMRLTPLPDPEPMIALGGYVVRCQGDIEWLVLSRDEGEWLKGAMAAVEKWRAAHA